MGPWLGVHGAPWVRQKRTLRISPFSSKICLTKSAAGPSCGDPKTGLPGSLHAKKCWEAFYTVPRHHRITMGPYRGVPRAPWIRQNPTWKNFTVLQPNLPYSTHTPARTAVFGDPKTRLQGPCGQTNAWMPPTVPQDTTQSVWDPTLSSLGPPGSGKIKKIAQFTCFRGPDKETSARTPKKHKDAEKSKMRKNEAVSANIFA